MSELRALRQRKDELETHLATLQDSRRQLMVQLEGLMKMLKVLLPTFHKIASVKIKRVPIQFSVSKDETRRRIDEMWKFITKEDYCFT